MSAALSAGNALGAALLVSAVVFTRRGAALGASRAHLGRSVMSILLLAAGAVLGASFALPGAAVWPATGGVLAMATIRARSCLPGSWSLMRTG